MRLLFKYTHLFFLSLVLLIAHSSMAQEICNNAIDDDSDGLVDLYDPECQCHFNVDGNLLLNGSFEWYDHCPVSFTYDDDHAIAQYWDYGNYTNINQADFYHNLHCGYDSALTMLNMPPALPLQQGIAFI
jgi:hypothetical protein